MRNIPATNMAMERQSKNRGEVPRRPSSQLPEKAPTTTKIPISRTMAEARAITLSAFGLSIHHPLDVPRRAAAVSLRRSNVKACAVPNSPIFRPRSKKQ